MLVNTTACSLTFLFALGGKHREHNETGNHQYGIEGKPGHHHPEGLLVTEGLTDCH